MNQQVAAVFGAVQAHAPIVAGPIASHMAGSIHARSRCTVGQSSASSAGAMTVSHTAHGEGSGAGQTGPSACLICEQQGLFERNEEEGSVVVSCASRR